MHIVKKLLAISISGIIFLGLVGCSSSDEDPSVPKELKESTFSVDTPERELFDTARQLYNSGLYTLAKESFESLRDGYPFGAYSEFAEVKIADCAFYSNDYKTAAITYEDFFKEHPSSSSAPYVLMQAARSYHLASGGVGRDPTPILEAVKMYDRVLNEYPNSIYYDLAKTYRDEAKRDVAAYQIKVLDFYKAQGKEKAYKARLAEFNDAWGEVESSRSLIETALENPDDNANLKRIKELGARAVPRAPLFAESPPPTVIRSTRDIDSQNLEKNKLSNIREIECNNNEVKEIVFYLNKPVTDPDFEAKYSSLKPQGGIIDITIPGDVLRPETIDCFKKGDLKILEDNKIQITTDLNGESVLMNNPPRVVVLLAE